MITKKNIFFILLFCGNFLLNTILQYKLYGTFENVDRWLDLYYHFSFSFNVLFGSLGFYFLVNDKNIKGILLSTILFAIIRIGYRIGYLFGLWNVKYTSELSYLLIVLLFIIISCQSFSGFLPKSVIIRLWCLGLWYRACYFFKCRFQKGLKK